MGDVSKTISLGKDGLIKTSGDGSSGDGSGISTSSIGNAAIKAAKAVRSVAKSAGKVAYQAKGRSYKKKDSKTRSVRPVRRP